MKLTSYFTFFVIAIIFITSFTGFSQERTTIFDTAQTKVEEPEQLTFEEEKQVSQDIPGEFKSWSSYEFSLSFMVLVFGLFLILLEVFLIKTNKLDGEETLRFILITIIITATLFLITAGYSSTQIASAIGLLGTIAGYLLGKQSAKIDTEKSSQHE